MFGIPIKGNIDFRRILTDYGFMGYPLRKDFPLTGFSEIYYDDSKKRILYESIEMAQELRIFNFANI
jgi:NADH-quinone oxidoreductase subunit C